jgi:hypothetical protein
VYRMLLHHTGHQIAKRKKREGREWRVSSRPRFFHGSIRRHFFLLLRGKITTTVEKKSVCHSFPSQLSHM